MSGEEHGHEGLGRRMAGLRDTADYRAEQVIDSVTEAIVDRMLELGLNRTELANLLGVSPARITNLLRGANNFTVRTLIDVSVALDCSLMIALVPHEAGRSVVAAESRAAYRTTRPRHPYVSRDDEIREHLVSGKLKVDGGRVYMRHESDQTYRVARFRKTGAHSAKEKTDVGRRAYYRDRIIAVAREMKDPR
ncbi:MAG: helix-turn-helix transcriptional regulator [Coriobacteriia bacterium]